MTQEEKSLLLRDLCTRLPYSTLCYCKWTKDAPNGTSGCVQEVSTYLLEELMVIGDQNYECQICEIKPFLRSMSSMTEKEKKEFYNVIKERCDYDGIHLIGNEGGYIIHYSWINKCIDWLNIHHFDYCGLIPMGLALESPEEIYNLK